MNRIIAFVPCRKGSERVLNKNTKPFSGIKGGLIEIKIKQLIESSKIDKILISTDDEIVRQTAYSLLKDSPKDYEILDRPFELATSTTSTDDVVNYVGEIVKEKGAEILWTHVTSPFINSKIYDSAISEYNIKKEQNYDSLVSVTKVQKFLWNSEGIPVNYDRSIEKWPRTQTITPLFEVNSGFFLTSIDVYRDMGDRVGKKPFLYEISDKESMDIDWQEDFLLAEKLWDEDVSDNLNWSNISRV